MSTGRYAAETQVPVERTIGDLRKVVQRYGATEYGSFESAAHAGIMFTLQGRRIKIAMALPLAKDHQRNARGAALGTTQAKQAHEKALRQRWRALLLVVKAKLEAVQSGIETIDQAFMPYLVMAGGQTIGEAVLGQIESGQLPLLGSGT